MNGELGAWLRQERENRGWSKHETARQLIRAGHEAGDTAMPELAGMLHNIQRWERQGGVSERHQLHYCRAYGIHPSQFGPPASGEPADATAPATVTTLPPAALIPAQEPAPAAELAGPHLPVSAFVAYRGRQQPALEQFTVEREVLMAAHEGSDRAEDYEQHGVGETTAEQLRADVARLSRLTAGGPPLPVFLDLRRVRDRVYRLLDRRLWPREQTDLHFLLGCLNGLMGITANRLGYPDAAEELIRAGYASAAAIDHRPLQAQLRQQLSSIAYLRGRITESDELAITGREYLSDGPEAAHLYLNHASAAGSVTPTPRAGPSARHTRHATGTTATTSSASAASSPSRWLPTTPSRGRP